MVVISETSGEGSNGGDPTKNPQEEENQNEKPKEEVENLAPVPQHENLAPAPYQYHIPVVIEDTVARVRRCHYPKLSLISKAYRHLISSPGLFSTRLFLGLTEPVLYALIGFPPYDYVSDSPRWYILHRIKKNLELSRVTSLPPMFPGSTTVTIGPKMYVMGGYVVGSGLSQSVNNVIVIDCKFHTWESLQGMKRDRCYAASGVIDGKIYVVGGCKKRDDDWVEVFDVETGIWETVSSRCPNEASSAGMFYIHVVLDNKIYILERDYCLAYDPRQRRWETWGYGSQQSFFWHASSCVVDDLLYAIVPQSVLGSHIVVFDPRVMVWRPVKGINFLPGLVYSESRTANFGGKLMVLGSYHSRWDSCSHHNSEKLVWCVEVALEKREDGDIWGKFIGISHVHSFRERPFIELSRTVTV